MSEVASAADPREAAFDVNAVRTHCAHLHDLAQGHNGVLVVSVFHASPVGQTDAPGVVTHHPVGEVEGMVAAIMAQDGVPGANCYVGLQVMRKGIERGRRGTENDIVAVLGLVADMDSDTGKASGALPYDPSYVVETSPGNKQPAWVFDKALPAAEAKSLAISLRAATGSDHGTADVAHVWRIPGTLNWPNRKKIERGRPLEPARVTMLKPFDGTLVEASAFRRSLPAASLSTSASATLGELPAIEGLTLSSEALALLAANDVGDRSAHAARVVERLAFDGLSAEEVATAFLAATGDWRQRYSNDRHALADVGRLYGKDKARRDAARLAGSSAASKLAASARKPSPVAANDNQPRYPGIVSSAELVRGFVPPDYHIDGIAQRGFLYSVTAASGTGKTAILLRLAAMTALGLPLGEREITQGRVLYFAGENPDDVTMRWIASAHAMGFDAETIDVHFIRGVFSIPALIGRVKDDIAALGGVGMIVVDTSAAYFQGEDENANVALGRHARELRELTTVKGSPCVMVACHPTKNAAQDNLLPRGGGAFIAEVDGNLVCQKGDQGVVKLHWQGKHRGPDFEPEAFQLSTVTAPALTDSKGRPVPTVLATPLSVGEVREKRDEARRDEDAALIEVDRDGSQSIRDMADRQGWKNARGEPDKERMRRATDKLQRSKLAIYSGRRWKLTPAGADLLQEVKAERFQVDRAAASVARLVARSRVESSKYGQHD